VVVKAASSEVDIVSHSYYVEMEYSYVRAGYETYSDFGFSFEYPEGMEVYERMLKMIKTEEGALLYMSPMNNDNAGAVCGNLEKDDKMVELIDMAWRQMEPVTLSKEDADKFFARIGEEEPVTDIRRGEFGEREFAGHSMIYQYYTIDFGGTTYNGIWSSWYCETSQRKYECFVETIEEDINPIFNRYLKSLVCHQPGYDYSTHTTYSKFDISFEYLKDYHGLEEMGMDESGEIVTGADFNFGMVSYQLRYPNEELERGFREVTWFIRWLKVEEPIYVTVEDVDWFFVWEGHTFERGELVETTTKTGHRMLYQDYVLTALWDVSTGASLLYEDETALGVYGVWYCDDSQRLFGMSVDVTTVENPLTIFENFLDTFSCHERAPKGSLKIIVQDENENPISGATVSSTSKPNGQEALGGTSGSDGLVTFVDVSIGDYTFQASKSEYETSSESVTVIEDETITLTIQLKEQVGTLKILVKDEEGNPISGATVTSTSQPSGQSSLSGTTGSDGSVTFTDVKSGNYTFQASKSEYVTKSGAVSAKVGETAELTITLEKETLPAEEKKGCIIATATYGSELSPEVQFLRGFRDNTVLTTFAGRNFMTVFNALYYSFSPAVASIIAGNNLLRGLMKYILYPLIGILRLTATTYSIFRFNPELGVVVSGIVASSLLGIIYFTPIVLILCLVKKAKIPTKVLHVQSLILIISVGCITGAEIIQWSGLMMFSTAMFVLTIVSLTTLASMRYLTERIQA